MSMKLAGKKVVMIVAQEYEDIELLYPLLRLSEEGAEILVVPVPMGFHTRPYITGKPVTGRFGHPVPIPIMPEGKRYRVYDLGQIKASQVDCVLIPGGFSPDYLRRDGGTLELVRQCAQQAEDLYFPLLGYHAVNLPYSENATEPESLRLA